MRRSKILEAYMKQALAEKKHIGLSFALSSNGERTFWNYGHKSVDAWTEVSENYFFETGSVGKIYTALLIAKLIDEESLSKDTPISQWVPEISSNLKINVWQL